jgi:AAA domain
VTAPQQTASQPVWARCAWCAEDAWCMPTDDNQGCTWWCCQPDYQANRRTIREGVITVLAPSPAPGRDRGQPLKVPQPRPEVMRDAMRRWWRPGDPVPEGLNPADVEADYEMDVLWQARKLAQARDARRELDAQGWQPPDVTAPLSDELALPRMTYAHRIDGLAGWNHNVLIAGERKVGKSTLLFNLSAGLSRGSCAPDMTWTPGTFLGPWTTCWLGGNVGYWNAEMDKDDFLDEFRKLPAGALEAARIRALHFRGLAVPVITSPAARAWFVSWLRENEIEVLIIDTWGAFCAANGVRNLSDDAEVRVITSGLDAIKRETWVRSLFIPIHTPHQTGERHLERFKGAGAVGDWADTLWTYVKDAAGVRYLWAEGRAGIGKDETSVGWSPDTGLLSWSYEGNRMQTARERQRSKAVKALETAGMAGLGAEELKDAAGGNRASAAGVIGDLLGEGLADVEKNGRAKIYRLKDYRKDQPDQGG